MHTPRLERLHARPGRQFIGTIDGGQDPAAVEQKTSELVKVIHMVLMAKKHSIDWRQLRGSERWRGRHLEGDEAQIPTLDASASFLVRKKRERECIPFSSGGGKDGVRQEVDAVDMDNGRGCPDVRDAEGAFEADSR